MAALFDPSVSQAALEQAFAAAWLLAARMLPLVALVPAFGVRGAPASWLVTATVALSVMLVPTALAHAATLPVSALPLAALSLREIVVGSLWALALALPFLALEWGGRIADELRGLGPGAGGASALGDLYRWLALAGFVALGGYEVVVAALADGLRTHPLGLLAPAGGLGTLATASARLCGDALAAGVMVALPVAAVLVFAELVVGVVARGMPAVAGFLAFAPARSVLVLAVVLLGSAALLGALPVLFERALADARRLLEAFP